MARPTESGNTFRRLPYLIYLISFLFILALSIELEPSADGHGTHKQLGLPACGFLSITGYPCPSCGITTSFSYFVRGDLLDALRVQPFGFVLFTVLIAGFAISVYATLHSIPATDLLDSVLFERVQVALLIIFLLSWIYKIYTMRN
jgi:hypothetical protein